MTMQTHHIGVALAAAGLLASAGSAMAQPGQYSLDDNPSMPIVGAPIPPFQSAEDPYGFGLPATLAGVVGPSPSLSFGYIDGDILLGPVGPGLPPHVAAPSPYLDALSGDHVLVTPAVLPRLNLQFSVDRATTGLPGTALFAENMVNQHPGDIYSSTASFTHPQAFKGTLAPIGAPVPTFAGVLPTAGGGGSNLLVLDESAFGLTPGLGTGITVPAGFPSPPITPGSHDNVDAYNLVQGKLDIDGDMVNDVPYFHSEPPVITATPGDIYKVMPGGASGVYAGAGMLGLDALGVGTDDVDALIMWDSAGGPDFALFSLSPGSASLASLAGGAPGIDAATIFFTDFSGLFAVYAFGSDLGIDAQGPLSLNEFANVDALAIVPAPSSLALLGIGAGLLARRRR
jgi:hypothetical protein